MRKARQQSTDVAGDWSTTGTFLRKPAGGWLHEDQELQNGLSINYDVHVSWDVDRWQRLRSTYALWTLVTVSSDRQELAIHQGQGMA